jgi:hypothetical protein
VAEGEIVRTVCVVVAAWVGTLKVRARARGRIETSGRGVALMVALRM